MQSNQFRRTRVAAAVAGLALALGASQVLGAGFALQEQNGSGLGNAFSGGAAAAEDASTVWSNPAGMSRFKTIQVVAAGDVLMTSNKFRNDGSLAALNQPLGGNGGNAGITALLPAMYVVVPINEQFAFGLGIGAPFGLETDWDGGWLGRYQALNSKVETLNVNPVFSWKINDSFTVAAGADWQRIKANLTSNFNYSAGLADAAQKAAAAGQITPAQAQAFVAATGGLDSNNKLTGDDSAWGWNIGVMWNISPDTRVGAHYRSSIKYDVSGNVQIDNPPLPPLGPLAPIGALLSAAVNAQLASGGVTLALEVPSITNVSFFSRINPNWEVMGDVQFTQWSVFKELAPIRTGPGRPIPATPENFKDVWRVSAGANYIVDSEWKLRGGLAWDQSPVNDTDRTPRLPDADRFWVAAGAQYTYAKQWKFDVGMAYIWAQNASSNQNAGSTATYGLIKGSYDSSVFIVGGQVAYSF
ncbi:MAG TPA: outer membrane protein transport protein [Casimicrobiaceae bacterium]|nr:outer membrane protein transport protein [Casimicrobiaceae bacterium]